MHDEELMKKTADFLFWFENVFETDWMYAIEQFQAWSSSWGEETSFLDPRLDDEGINWGNREELMKSYRALYEVLAKRGKLPRPSWVDDLE